MSKAFSYIAKALCIILVVSVLVFLISYTQKNYLKNAYPIKYSEYIEEYSQKRELDPYFVYAVIRTESDFTKDATSSVNARGLMQITEETFEWIKGKIGDKQSSFDDMYNPEKSIEYGTYLLSYLKNTLGSEQNILCGYHAGVNRAKNWLSDSEFSQNNEIIVENIPFEDTKQYVNKVMKTYQMYLDLYKR